MLHMLPSSADSNSASETSSERSLDYSGSMARGYGSNIVEGVAGLCSSFEAGSEGRESNKRSALAEMHISTKLSGIDIVPSSET